MSNIAIEVKDLAKVYRLGKAEEKSDTLAGSIVNALKSPISNFRRLKSLSSFKEENDATILYALKDINFEVKHGETLAIIGRNGAGKSTLLKIISRITDPSSGRINVYGRVASLLEVGTGFHGELTGRENVYLNGTILGMRKVEIDRKFDEIVAFSDIEKFIDTPVKWYSSGMRVRLAFSVAAHLDPEILIIDEVLAVGDAEFQKKCLGKMGEVAGEGRTVLFVSHSMSAVQNLCSRAIWLEKGQMKLDGPTGSVIGSYLSDIINNAFSYYSPKFGLHINAVTLKNKDNKNALDFIAGEPLTVEIDYTAEKMIPGINFQLGIYSTYGPCFIASMLMDGNNFDMQEGKGVLRCTFKSLPLLPNMYQLMLGIRDETSQEKIMDTTEINTFRVVGKLTAYGLNGLNAAKTAAKSIPMIIDYDWEYNDKSVKSFSLTNSYNPGLDDEN